jgi:hypothetical protein
MATGTQTETALLDEAAAIVEAEWIRLQQEADVWREIADLFAEMPAPRPHLPRGGITPPLQGPGKPLGPSRRRWPPHGWPARKIWATQRSPPVERVLAWKARSDIGGDAPKR